MPKIEHTAAEVLATTWRSSWRLGLSTQCRSSSTRTTGVCRLASSSRPTAGGVEEVALGVGVGALGWWEIPQALLEGGHQAGQLAPVGGDVGTEQAFFAWAT